MKCSEILTNINQETNGNRLHQIKLSCWVQQIILSQLTGSSIKIKNSRQNLLLQISFLGRWHIGKWNQTQEKLIAFLNCICFLKKFISVYKNFTFNLDYKVTYKISKWLAVKFNKKWYPGEVVDTLNNEIRISCMA